jgi:hypothetical protein
MWVLKPQFGESPVVVARVGANRPGRSFAPLAEGEPQRGCEFLGRCQPYVSLSAEKAEYDGMRDPGFLGDAVHGLAAVSDRGTQLGGKRFTFHGLNLRLGLSVAIGN